MQSITRPWADARSDGQLPDASCERPHSEPPLVVDLDGTLVATDLMLEACWGLLATAPGAALGLTASLAGGKATFKRRLAERIGIDATRLPYREPVLQMIDQARAAGRRVVLCTAADRLHAQAVADHIGRFDEVLASDGHCNLAGANKAALLVARFGLRGFDYVGDSRTDLPVWSAARHGVVVGGSAALRSQVRAGSLRSVDVSRAGVHVWLGALRVHHWLKNLLLWLPLLAAHRLLDVAAMGSAALAFLAFGLAASAGYLLNDLLDLPSDRVHAHKRSRAIAAGRLPLKSAMASLPLLLLAAALLSLALPPAFGAWLCAYLALALAYSTWLKRKPLIDVITVAALHTLRIVAGGAAVGIPPSFWLLAFSMLLFLSLAFVKRCSELRTLGGGDTRAAGRGYIAADLPLVQMLGIASAFAAVLVLALYINGDAVLQLYRTPQALWLALPLVLYWIGRMWLQTQRGHMDDDPLLFALRDRTSLICAALFATLLWVGSRSW